MEIKTHLCCAYDDYRNYLRQITDVSSYAYYRLRIKDNSTRVHKFYGVITDNSFRLIPIVLGKNFFTPVFVGYFYGSSPVNVEIKVVNSPPVIVYYVFLLISQFCLMLGLVSDLLNGSGLGSAFFHDLMVLGMSLILFIVFSLVVYQMRKKYVARFLHYLNNTEYLNTGDSSLR